MLLTFTQRSHTPRDPSKFPLAQLLLLSCVRLAEPIALTSILPYAWKLVLDFHVGDRDNASFYAGLLISAFSLAESFTGMFWGSLSDRIGRKPVLIYGCAGTAMSLFIVGFSTNFWMALFGRALGGLLNGNVGVIQTMVGEMVTLPEHEPRAYSFMPFVWSIGAIVGPIIGGLFSSPSENFPSLFPSDGLFAKFPYLLPNLICAFLLFAAIVMGALLIEETHPDLQQGSPAEMRSEISTVHTALLPTSGATEHAPADLRSESYGTFNTVTRYEDEQWRVRSDGRSISSTSTTIHENAFTRRVVMLVVALAFFTYHAMTFDHLLPIFLQDDRVGDVSALSASQAMSGGLGLSLQQVGLICSINGAIALFVQAVIFPLAANRFGIWKLFIIVTIGHPISYFLVPYLTLAPPNLMYPAIIGCLILRNLTSIIAYPLLLILLKEAAPKPSSLGKINGLAASVGAGMRCIASPTAGYLYAIGLKIEFTALAWWASAAIAVFGAAQVFFIDRQKNKHSYIESPLPCHFVSEETKEYSPRIIHILVDDIDARADEEEDETTALI